ncbi:hypothetical protein B566_EDAN008229, partial [Ephemera danica]
MSNPNVDGYVIVGKIGSGSYATVYKAFKKSGPREVVAIKCVEKTKLSTATIDNLITEISLLKKIKHPNIVEMKDFLWDSTHIHIVMEYCAGGDLSTYIHKKRQLSEKLCQRFLQQLASALQYLRLQNVSHMDLKPQNLLLSSPCKPVLKVGDFGFAQTMKASDHGSSLRGSPLYMAPEILLAKSYDAKVDLWSVGVILYEALFGKAPYSSPSLDELLTKVKSHAPIEMPPGGRVSPACQDLLSRLLQPDPSKRIDFCDFFNHPFLDLEHAPGPESLKTAAKLANQAVQADQEQHPQEALHLYCQALHYCGPLLHAESDPERRAALRSRMDQYMRRAEELKLSLAANQIIAQPSQANGGGGAETDFMELVRLSAATPAMKSALELGTVAEQYAHENSLAIALEKFQAALASLIELLTQEVPGSRRQALLHRQVQKWLCQAEEVKALLEMQNLKNS